MSLLPLHLLGSPVLRQRSAEVGPVDDEVRRLVDDMFETMDAARGVGLAANQVGIARRIAVVDADGDRFAMIDPVIVETEGVATAEEGCLSIPEIYADVTRPERVVIEAFDREGDRYRREATGQAGRPRQDPHPADVARSLLGAETSRPDRPSRREQRAMQLVERRHGAAKPSRSSRAGGPPRGRRAAARTRARRRHSGRTARRVPAGRPAPAVPRSVDAGSRR